MKDLDVLFINIGTACIAWLNILGQVLGIIAVLLGICYTIWRWRRDLKKDSPYSNLGKKNKKE